MLEGSAPAAFQQPSQMQQIISTSSLKELQRSSTFTSSPKWSEGYIWASISDAGQWVLGQIRPTRSINRDPNFALTSAFYHLSMIPEYGEHQSTADPAASADTTAAQPTASGEAATESSRPYVKWCLIN
eukprot:3776795-Amphidinium_carterae.1